MIPFTLIINAENVPGVLARVTGMFTRRRLNIEEVHAYKTDQPGISQMKISSQASISDVQKLIKQMERIIEVTEVTVVYPGSEKSS
jgi:acetolactate synthase I/III small subunit